MLCECKFSGSAKLRKNRFSSDSVDEDGARACSLSHKRIVEIREDPAEARGVAEE